MARQMEVVTPENVPVTFELAGIGSRFGAMMIDLMVQIAVFLVGLIVGAVLGSLLEIFSGAGSFVTAAIFIWGFLVLFGYFILFETLWNGQTPGKRMFNLRVIRDGGYPVGFYGAATRNLTRLADFIPFSYAAGALAVFFHPQYKRLGDLVAGTVVIKEREIGSIWLVGLKHSQGAGQGAPRLPDTMQDPVNVLTPAEIAVLRRFSLRRWEMTADDAERVAYRLIVPLVGRLNLTFLPGVAPRYADLVTVMVADIDTKLGKDELF